MPRLLALWITIVAINLSACSQAGLYGNWSLGPITISVNTSSDISIKVNPGITVPTPIGIFSAGVYINPALDFEVESTLIIRLNGRDHIYDLHGEDFVLSLPSGTYQGIQISKFGQNVLIEITASNPQMILDQSAAQSDSQSVSATSAPSTAPSGQNAVSSGCSGLPTYLAVGETVILDFDDGSALRILTEVTGGAENAVGQAYGDNQFLILDGPRCGRIRARNVNAWYWYAKHLPTGKYGWVAEGVPGDRWLCELANPECGS